MYMNRFKKNGTKLQIIVGKISSLSKEVSKAFSKTLDCKRKGTYWWNSGMKRLIIKCSKELVSASINPRNFQ